MVEPTEWLFYLLRCTTLGLINVNIMVVYLYFIMVYKLF